MGVDLSFLREGTKFNVRAAAIIMHEGYILCDREEGLDYSYLPGGRIQRGETSAQALVREMREELDVSVQAGDPLIICESFYMSGDMPLHEMSFYFLVEKPAALPFAKNQICHTHREDGVEFHHSWVEVSEVGMARAKVEPKQLHQLFIELPNSTVHVTINELD